MGAKRLEIRRYLCQFQALDLPQLFTDVLVVGGGVAGLRAAIEASDHGRVIVVAKAEFPECNTFYAQGGIAVANSPGDSPEKHIQDTVKAGHGLCDEEVVKIVVEDGIECVEELISFGARFDRSGKELAYTREGGHSWPRILHAEGDATGREVERALLERARATKNCRLFERTFGVDLLTQEGQCLGGLFWNAEKGLHAIWAKETILATGGAGRLYRETTNPPVATGDGLAMAFRAGATVQDMEFMQFHPTTLYVAGATRVLISEAVRGEGAYLRDRWGKRFMPDYHERAELAPRDAVSRAITRQMQKVGDAAVYLDCRHLDPARIRARFPSLTQVCAEFDLDLATDLIPVRPSAHYTIGGVRTDAQGRSDVRSLLAAGECASTGLHGANRLGSNSLLEGLVFGRRAGRAAGEALHAHKRFLKPVEVESRFTEQHAASVDVADVEASLRSVLQRQVGIERDEGSLAQASGQIGFWARYVLDKEFRDPRGFELQNLLLIAKLLAMSAKAREETRGVHYRTDFPERDDARFQRHLTWTMNDLLGNG